MLHGPDIPNFFRGAVSYADKLRIRSATINLQTSMLLAYGQQIAASALEKRLPTVYGYREPPYRVDDVISEMNAT